MSAAKEPQEPAPEIKRSVGKPSNIGRSDAPPELTSSPGFAVPALKTKPQIAVFITHGMGQQVPFETLDNVAEGLTKAAARKNGSPITGIRARTVQIGEIKTQRAEIDMRDANGAEVEVHVYESYWAPFTEGQVTLRDVMSFLVRAGLNGLWNSLSPFRRWLFGGWVSFGKQARAAISLAATLCVVVSLTVLNFVISLAGSDRLVSPLLHGNDSYAIADATFDALTSLTGGYLLISMVVVGVLAALYGAKRVVQSPSKSKIWKAATWCLGVLFLIWVLATAATAVVAVLLLAGDSIAPARLHCQWLSDKWIWIWGALLAASWLIRGVLVQYLGDVAAYVSAHWLDRFNDLRKKIKDTAYTQAKAVYSVPEYKRIAIVGHSLGSVIVYDTLNALINDDQLGTVKDLAGQPLNVVERTRLLLTFGSPLDKTAFIFVTQWKKTTATREALAASLQPMISDYLPSRDIKWINIHSPRDVISAHLDFYDDAAAPDASGRTVNNIADPDALLPLIAHVESWENETLFDQLYANL